LNPVLRAVKNARRRPHDAKSSKFEWEFFVQSAQLSVVSL
jgi:hypothetical protein